MSLWSRTRTWLRWLRLGTVGLLVAAILVVVNPAPAFASFADKRDDFHRDGVSDLLVFYKDTGCLELWTGTGNGNVAYSNRIGSGCAWGNYEVNGLASPGDLNSDGNADIVGIHTGDNCLYRWMGNGNRGVGSAIRHSCSGWAPYKYALIGAGDLNNDGLGDLLAVRDEPLPPSTNDGCLYRWFGTGNGGLGNASRIGCGWWPYALTLTGAGDINNDGNADLVSLRIYGGETYGCVYRWFGNGRGGFSSPSIWACGFNDYTSAAGVGDLNPTGNKAGDLLAVDESSCLERWLGDDAGGWGSFYELSCSSAWASANLVT